MFKSKSNKERQKTRKRARSLDKRFHRAWWKRLIFWKAKNRRIHVGTDEPLPRKKRSSERFARELRKVQRISRESTQKIWKVIRHIAPSLFRIIGVFAVFFVIIGLGRELYRFLSANPHFSIRTIILPSTKHVPREQMEAYTKSYFEKNIFRINLLEIQRDLASIPDIQYVRVKRRLPDTLSVEIIEFEPSLMIHLDHLYMIDHQGFLYRSATNDDEGKYPVIEGLSRAWYQAHRLEAQGILQDAIFLLKSYYSMTKNGWPMISSIRLILSRERGDHLEDFVLSTTSGLEIWLDGESPQKTKKALRNFELIWTEIQKRHENPSVILVNNRARPDWVVVRD